MYDLTETSPRQVVVKEVQTGGSKRGVDEKKCGSPVKPKNENWLAGTIHGQTLQR